MDGGLQFRLQINDLFNQHIVTGMDRKVVKWLSEIPSEIPDQKIWQPSPY